MSIRLDYPFEPHLITRKRRSLKRKLLETSGLVEKRIAIMGGSTTAEIRDMLELFLLDAGIRPVFYESEYNRYYEETVFPNQAMQDFRPDVVYIHTTQVNINQELLSRYEPDEIAAAAEQEFQRFVEIWDAVEDRFGCLIVQNNMDLPPQMPLGSLEATRGSAQLIEQLNRRFHEASWSRGNVAIHDIHWLSAWVGLRTWFNPTYWHAYKYAVSYDAIPYLAHSLAGLLRAVWGKSRKCLVLDLDNTLWGGVIGDDGVDGIRLGEDSSEGQAFLAFQRYLKNLRQRGVLLAVCSKNNEEIARGAFEHPDMLLRTVDFQAFKVNWDPKPLNLQGVASELNIGLDSLVFVDDNPVERELVRAQLPMVAVPEMGDDPSLYPEILDRNRYFEVVQLSHEDLRRQQYYEVNLNRKSEQSKFESYERFLESLEMVAEIRPFERVYLERITQLINKTNQFNLTTRRYTPAEVQAIAESADHLTLYGRLTDKFGDNGLVSVIIGSRHSQSLQIDVWLMSCRVFKRGLEYAIFRELVRVTRDAGIKELLGTYLPTAKNGIVAEFYRELGFELVDEQQGEATRWRYDITDDSGLPPDSITIRIERELRTDP